MPLIRKSRLRGWHFWKHSHCPDSRCVLLTSRAFASRLCDGAVKSHPRRNVSEEVSVPRVGSGSRYYFPLSGPLFRAANITTESCEKELMKRGHCSHRTDDKSACVQIIRGSLRNFSINTSIPPLNEEEMVRWKLDRHLYSMAIHFTVDGPPSFLLPPTAQVLSLGPEMDEVDLLYRRKGFYTPSEIASALFPAVPTFFVETRHVLNLLPPEIMTVIHRDVKRWNLIQCLFGRYPMLFKVHKGRYQKTVVKLNADFWFVRAHPHFMTADRLQYRNNADFSLSGGGLLTSEALTGSEPPGASPTPGSPPTIPQRRSIDMTILDILVRHLPRVPRRKPALDSPVEENEIDKRYQSFSLVQWINSFPSEELDVLNKVPQQRVVTILNRYCRIFQLTCPTGEDMNLYADRQCFAQRLPSVDEYRGSGVEASSREMLPSEQSAEALRSSPSQEVTSVPSMLDSAHEEWVKGVEDPAPSLTPEEVAARVKSFESAVKEELIGMEDLVSDTNGDGKLCAQPSFEDLTCDPVLSFSQDRHGVDTGPGSGVDCDNEEVDSVNRVADDCDREAEICDVTETQDKAAMNEDGYYVAHNFDMIHVRRLPPNIAPRCLSNFNELTTPEPGLVHLVASFLAPPPSLQTSRAHIFQTAFKMHKDLFVKADGRVTPHTVWRWVPVQRIYAVLSADQRRQLRVYKGLVSFLRLHGQLFELSADFLHVIAHDPTGIVAPLLPAQKTFPFEERVVLPTTFDEDVNATAALIGEHERRKYEELLGHSQLPTDRQQLLLLDPHNPLLQHDVLYEEIANLLPDHPVSVAQLMSRLPPMIKAAASLKFNLRASRHVRIFTLRGQQMVQRSDLQLPEEVRKRERVSVEEAVEQIREAVPMDGVTILALKRMHMSSSAVDVLEEKFGSVYAAVLGYPQYFRVVAAAPLRDSTVYPV